MKSALRSLLCRRSLAGGGSQHEPANAPGLVAPPTSKLSNPQSRGTFVVPGNRVGNLFRNSLRIFARKLMPKSRLKPLDNPAMNRPGFVRGLVT